MLLLLFFLWLVSILFVWALCRVAAHADRHLDEAELQLCIDELKQLAKELNND